MWGPDCWLYAVNGSTTVGNVSSRRTPATRFEGQCVWRYHPQKEVFEIYAEGGGNNFSLEIDAKGRVFSGTNGGNTRGWYFPQGSYSHKNWGKHGPLTNPYAFGYFPPMRFKGDGRRFPQAFTIYEGGLLDEAFAGAIVAPNAMQNLVWHSERLRDGSTYQTIDLPNLLESTDRWFRPVYCGVGPDGAIYIADWYDSRLSHISPTDDWHKSSGRIYRIAPENTQPRYDLGDLAKKSDADLISLLTHRNKWVRQRSVLELSWRESIQDSTLKVLQSAAMASSLEALWVLGNRELLTDALADELLVNADADVRRWVVRLLGDAHRNHGGLTTLAHRETDIQVRSQLASTARRIKATTGLQITRNLLAHSQDAKDPHMPLMLWWAVEEHAEHWDDMLAFLADESLWDEPLFASAIAPRLLRRYAATGGAADLERCSEILNICPTAELKPILLSGLNRAFQGRIIPPLPPSLQTALSEFRAASGVYGLALGVRQAEANSQKSALAKLSSSATPTDDRIELASAFGDTAYRPAATVLLTLATRRSDSPALQRVALTALAAYDDPKIGQTICKYMNSTISEDYGLRDAACRTLASRQPWAEALLEELSSWRLKTQHIPPDVVQRLRVYSAPEFKGRVDSVFGPPAQISSEEVRRRIGELKTLLADQTAGNLERGREVFIANCGNCHSLFGVGSRIGPPLDNYDRANLDFWLPAIVAPSLEIREGYQSYAALLVDGRVLTGRLHAQDLQVVSIATDDGQIHTIARSEIDELRALKSSLMPEKILSSLSDTQITDLFAYLRSRTNKKVTEQ
ncbi:MAG TPA: dehydrogenase [Planctomycetaceae bacterium]|nr:dehydrogenase [Planctomycetaceae bacterium]